MLEALKERVNQDAGLVRRGRYLTTTFLLQSGDASWLVSIFEGTDLEDALAAMRRSEAHLARVLDRNGAVTGVLFLVSMVFAPLVSVIPSEAAVPALVLVGFLMMQQVAHIEWQDLEIAIPAFLTIVLMPFTYSISVGIGAGFLAYVLIKVVRGRARLVHPLLWVVTALFLLYFCIQPVKQLLGV